MNADTVVAVCQTGGGLALLLLGGEVLVRGAVALAQRFGLSQLLIGLTVVAAATSMPELVVAVTSTLHGVPDIGTGNVVGAHRPPRAIPGRTWPRARTR